MNPAAKRFLCSVLVMLLLAGCAVHSRKINYYSLSAMGLADLTAHGLAKTDVAIAIGPVKIPDYLKRTQIATRLDSNRYQFSEFNRWMGLVEENIIAVLGQNLGLLLGTDKIASFPWLEHFKPDYRVTIEFLQFDADLTGSATLVARWALTDPSGKNSLASGKVDFNRELDAPTYQSLVKAESQLLQAFSKALAAEISTLIAAQ